MGATGFDPRRGPMRTNQATPTTYKGIPMRSRVEAEYAMHLDKTCIRSDSWQYEPMQYADETGTYKPDFVMHGRIFIEIKADTVPLATIRKMHIVRATHPKAWLLLVVGYWLGDHYMFENAWQCLGDGECPECQ